MKRPPLPVMIYSTIIVGVIGYFVYAQLNGILYTNTAETEKFDPQGNPNNKSYGSNRSHGSSYYRYHK
ncbi:MAG: hypothetical protein ACK5Z2_20425 [Bacteroidota bacterium]|jgi:hypothetical protein